MAADLSKELATELARIDDDYTTLFFGEGEPDEWESGEEEQDVEKWIKRMTGMGEEN